MQLTVNITLTLNADDPADVQDAVRKALASSFGLSAGTKEVRIDGVPQELYAPYGNSTEEAQLDGDTYERYVGASVAEEASSTPTPPPAAAAPAPTPVAAPQPPVAAPTPTPEPEENEAVDSAGHVHDPRVHAANRSTRADGTWKSARGVSPEERERIEAENKGQATASAPITPPAPPAPPAAAAPAPTPEAAPAPAPQPPVAAPTPPAAPDSDGIEKDWRDEIVNPVMEGRLAFQDLTDELNAIGLGGAMEATNEQAKQVYDSLVLKGLLS